MGQQVLGHALEVLLQTYLVEVESRSLEETVLEVVEVEEDALAVHGGHGIALVEVETLGSLVLEGGQQGYGAPQQLDLSLTVAPACLTPGLEGIEEGARTEVVLQVAASVGRHGQDMGYGQLLVPEVLGQVDEGMVLLLAGAYDTYQGVAVDACKTEIPAVAAAPGDGDDRSRIVAAATAKECSETFHVAVLFEDRLHEVLAVTHREAEFGMGGRRDLEGEAVEL